MIERIGDRWPIVALALIGVGMMLGWAACLAWMRGLPPASPRVIFARGTWWMWLGFRRNEMKQALDRAAHMREIPD